MVKGRIINYKNGFFLVLIMDIAVLAFLFTPIANSLYSILEVMPNLKKTGAIVLLSSAQYTDEILDRNTYQRLFHAFRLYRAGYGDKIIVCGGTKSDGKIPISEAMKRTLVEIGISDSDIITETDSRNTYENIKNILPTLQSMKVERPIIVTSSYHMFRSIAVFNKLGIKAYSAPVPCYEKDIFHIALRTRFILELFREYGAIIYFWLRGWI